MMWNSEKILQPVWLGTRSLEETDFIQEKFIYNHRKNGINSVLLLNHPPTFAIGARKSWKNLLTERKELELMGFRFYQSSRGGDITYHWPGQLNVYPIINLKLHNLSPTKYMRYLEHVSLRVLCDMGISGERQDGYTGIWYNNDKIVSMGTRIFKNVSSYGFALNILGDFSPVEHIIPCGYIGKGFTTIERISGSKYDIFEVLTIVINNLSEVFEMDLMPVRRYDLLNKQQLELY